MNEKYKEWLEEKIEEALTAIEMLLHDLFYYRSTLKNAK